MLDPTITTLLTPAAILALVNILKSSFKIEGRWALLVALALAVAVGQAELHFGDLDWFVTLRESVIIGLSAAGVWDVAKTVTKPNQIEDPFAVDDLETHAELAELDIDPEWSAEAAPEHNGG